MFLETNGNVAWLYHCPKFYSPLQLMDECYNRIPIMYKENIRFVDPITRQTFQSADLQDCSDKHSNLFQLDVDDDKSWIELTPQITRVTGPYLFKPKEIIQKIKHSLASRQGASIYTYAQMQKFWDSSFQGLIQPTRLFANNLFGLSHLSKLLEKRIHPYIRESTMLFRKMRNSLRLFSICEIHTRLPSIHNKGYAYSQNHRPLTTLWQSIAWRFI